MNQKKWINMEKEQLELLKQIIQRLLPKKTIWAYGSRVTGSSDEKSDLDLVVFNCNKTQIADFRMALEESHLSFSVDVMDWNNIPDSFRQTIKEQYIVLQDIDQNLRIMQSSIKNLKAGGEMNQRSKGFSFIELVTALVILATLSIVSIPTYKKFIKRPYHAWLKTEMGKQNKYLELIKSVDGAYHQYLYAMGYKIKGKHLGNVGFKTGPNERPCCNLYPDPTRSSTTSSDLSEYNYMTLPKAMIKWDGSTTPKGGLFTNTQSICAHSQGCVLTTLVDIRDFAHHGLRNNTGDCNYRAYANNYRGAWCDCENFSLMGVSHYGRSGAVKADILKGDAIFILNQSGLLCEADRNKKDGTLKRDLHF